jgi:hypothetical protein
LPSAMEDLPLTGFLPVSRSCRGEQTTIKANQI